MIKILKEGRKRETDSLKFFVCRNCGAKWIADEEEYDVSYRNRNLYIMECPCCQNRTYSSRGKSKLLKKAISDEK